MVSRYPSSEEESRSFLRRGTPTEARAEPGHVRYRATGVTDQRDELPCANVRLTVPLPTANQDTQSVEWQLRNFEAGVPSNLRSSNFRTPAMTDRSVDV